MAPTLERGIEGPSETLAGSGPSLPPCIPLFNQQMYMESPLDARHCSRGWDCCGEQDLDSLQRPAG